MNQYPESKMIDDIIGRLKKQPNGLNRNKAVSHLEDAKAHVELLETKQWPSTRPSAGAQPMTGDAVGVMPYGTGSSPESMAMNCSCPPGGIDSSCPVHGF